MTPNLSILIKPGGKENRRGAPVRRLGFFLALLAIGLAILTSLSHSTSADFSSKGWSNSPQDSALRVMPQKSSGKSRLSEMNFRDNSSLKKTDADRRFTGWPVSQSAASTGTTCSRKHRHFRGRLHDSKKRLQLRRDCLRGCFQCSTRRKGTARLGPHRRFSGA